ncbi:MAG: formylglycine-generating enzyme family protein [Sulfuricellaceae bacterium]
MTSPNSPPSSRLPPVFPEAWASAWGQDRHGLWQSFTVGGITQVLRWIPPGQFLMGSPPDEPERSPDDSDWSERRHPVLLTEGYWLADTACTQALWQVVMGDNPSGFKGDDKPVENVSWQDISENFLPALNALLPGLEAGLPSEAQWEYACRAGTTTPFWFGETITPEQVNYNGNYPYRGGEKGLYRKQTVEVKALPANDWGLHQMHGNVWEWCADWLGPYAPGLATDPAGPPTGRARVLRGGSWFSDGWHCRSAERFGRVPDRRRDSFGFRLARGSSPRQAGSAGVAGVAAGSGTTAAAPDSPARRQER